MQDRRSFLGQVIGLFVATQLPFTAEPVKISRFRKPANKLELADRRMRLFHLTEEQVSRCKIFVIAENGEKFWAPRIERRIINPEVGYAEFRPAGVKVNQTIIYKGMGFVDDQGYLMAENDFEHGPVTLIDGDAIVANYTISL